MKLFSSSLKCVFFSVILYTLSTTLLNAQVEYESFFGEETTSYKVVQLSGGDRVDSLSYVADALFEGHVYKIFDRWYTSNSPIDPLYGAWAFHSDQIWLRESEDHSKLYMGYKFGFIPEVFFFDESEADLNMEIGDSLNYKVVESIYYNDDGKKVIEFNNGLKFIEGVGANVFTHSLGWYAQILCKFKDDEQVWNSVGTFHVESFCEMIITSLPEKKKEISKISFSPNPASRLVHININEPFLSGDLTLEIYDITGRLVKTMNVLENGGNNIIDISNFSEGSYIVNLINKDRLVAAGKLIISR